MSLDISILNHVSLKEIENVEPFLQELADLLNYKEDIELSIVFANNNFIQDINHQFREKDTPTDVLAFPSEMDFILGDIVVSLEMAQKQAKDGFEKEVETLLCHGFLHLLGYDHEKSEKDYKIMMDLQDSLMKQKKIGIQIYERNNKKI
jgi:probable rRNA maturation factor